MLDVAYVANKGSRLPSRLENVNQLQPDLLNLGPLLNQNINSDAAKEAGIQKPFESFKGTVRQALRPFPQYTNVQNRFQGTGYSNYQSLQVKFERRFATGIFFLNACTFSKLIDTGGAGNGAGNPIALDTFNRNLEKSLADDDQTHTWVTSLVYDLPFGPGQRWLNNRVLGNILGNWRLGASLRYYSGAPLRLTSGQSLPLFGGTNRPHQVAGVPVQNFSGDFDPGSDLYLNPDAFEDPAPFTFGTVGRTLPNLRAPAFLNENFTLAKVISFAENKEFEIYAIYLNAFNRAIFRAPTGNVSSRNFGRVTGQSNDPRQVELGFRIRW